MYTEHVKYHKKNCVSQKRNVHVYYKKSWQIIKIFHNYNTLNKLNII